MKKSDAIFLLLISLMATQSYGDIIPPPRYASDKFTAAATFQKTFSYEKRISKSFSIQPRGGIAILWPFYQQHLGGPAIPAGEVEIAVESRWYLFTVDLSRFFVGLYGGGAAIFPTYATLSTSVGLKAGYKVPIVKKIRYYFSVEPYAGISTHPVVLSTYHRSDEPEFFPGAILTFGFNVVSQWGKVGD